MSKSVDNRVVSIRFDNKLFEQKIASTVKVLDALERRLRSADGTSGLENMQKAADKVDFSSIGREADGSIGRINAMSAAFVTAVGTMTYAAMNAGSRITKALTIEPVLDGYKEYELNMNSIQTILSNTKADNTTLEDVNKTLNELNHYSDQTIYNFAEMTRNIGTFTAAGVDLDTSAKAIKGIANLAAISGSDSNQAASAMYQLSQALATGTVKLMDWNSVVNAGMGGEVFQKALWDTGKALGKITDSPVGETFDEWKERGNSFRESLQNEWLTSDVLTATLQSFTGDMTQEQLEALGYTEELALEMMELGKTGKAAATEVKTFSQLFTTMKETVGSGWSQSFKTVVGDFEEAKSLLTEISNVFGLVVGRSADYRNDTLEIWKSYGGRTQLIEGMKATLLSLYTIFRPISESFRELFPKKGAGDLLRYTKIFSEFGQRLAISGETANKVKRFFSGIFSVMKIGTEIIRQLFRFFKPFGDDLNDVGGGVLTISAEFGDFLVRLRKVLVEGKGLQKFFDGIRTRIQPLLTTLSQLKEKMPSFEGIGKTDIIRQGLTWLSQALTKFGNTAIAVDGPWQKLMDRLSAVPEVVDKIIAGIKDGIQKLRDALKPKNSETGKSPLEGVLSLSMLGGIGFAITRLIRAVKNFDFSGGLMGPLRDSLEQLSGTLKAMTMNLKANALLKIAAAIGILAVSIGILAKIEPLRLASASAAIAGATVQLVVAMKMLDGAAGSTLGAVKLAILSAGLVGLSLALALLAVPIVKLSKLSWEELGRGLAGLAGGMVILVAAVKMIGKTQRGLVRAGISMVFMALALQLMASAVDKFSKFSWEELRDGLRGIALSLGILVVAVNLLPTGGMIRAALAIGLISKFLSELAKAVIIFGEIKWDILKQGLLGVGAALGLIVLAMNLLPENIKMSALSLIGIAVALGLIANVVQTFGEIPVGKIVKGLLSVAGILAVLVVALSVMPNAVIGAMATLIVAAALVVLTNVVQDMAKIPIMEIVKGVLAIGGVLLVLALGLSLMPAAIPGAIAVGIVSGALILLSIVLTQIAKIPAKAILKGLLAIGGMFLVIGGASILLAKTIPFIIAFGGALISVAAAFLIFGIGVFVLGEGLQRLSKISKEGTENITRVLKAIIRLIPEFVGRVTEAILGAIDDFLKALPSMIDKLNKAFIKMVEGFIDSLPSLNKAFSDILTSVVDMVKKHAPRFISLGFHLLVKLMEGLDKNAGKLADKAYSIIGKLLDALNAHLPALIDKGADLIVKFVMGITKRADDVAFAMAILLLKMVETIEKLGPIAVDAIARMMELIISELGNFGTRIMNAGTNAFTSFLEGLKGNVDEIFKAIGEVLASILIGFGNLAMIFTLIGTWILDRILTAIGDGTQDIIDAATKVVTDFITGLGESAQKIVDAGGNALADFLRGIGDNITKVCGAAKEVAKKFANCVLELPGLLIAAGGAVLGKFLTGVLQALIYVPAAGFSIVRKLVSSVKERAVDFVTEAPNMVRDFVTSFIDTVRTEGANFFNSALDLGKEFLNGITAGLTGGDARVSGVAGNIGGSIIDGVKSMLNINSPSRVAIGIGGSVVEGLVIGLTKSVSAKDAAEQVASDVVGSLNSAIVDVGKITDRKFGEMNPRITPVVDMTKVLDSFGSIPDITKVPMDLSVGLNRARGVDIGGSNEEAATLAAQQPTIFNQTINSPKPLGPDDIYRDTRSLLRERTGR